MPPKSRPYCDVIQAWSRQKDQGEATPELYRALGQLAVGDLAGRFIGTTLLIPIGQRLHQILEIAVDACSEKRKEIDVAESESDG